MVRIKDQMAIWQVHLKFTKKKKKNQERDSANCLTFTLLTQMSQALDVDTDQES